MIRLACVDCDLELISTLGPLGVRFARGKAEQHVAREKHRVFLDVEGELQYFELLDTGAVLRSTLRRRESQSRR